MPESALIDASTLVSLAKIGALQHLKNIGWRLHSIAEVYDEVVTEGMRGGYADAFLIDEVFQDGSVKLLTTETGRRRSKLSLTDVMVIETAHRNCCMVLSNDQNLCSLAEDQSITCFGSPDILNRLYLRKAISSAERSNLLIALHRQARLSKENLEVYLKEHPNG